MAGNYVIIASGHKVMPPVGQINHAGCILYKVAGALSLLSRSCIYILCMCVRGAATVHHGYEKANCVLFAKVAATRDYELGGDAAN